MLAEAQDDATVLAIRAQEQAGLDIVTDGEIRRESYSNRFATALEGVDLDNPGTALDRSGHPNPVPRVVGPHPAQARRSRSTTCSSCAAHTRSAREDHRARPVHDVAAGADRVLRRQPRARRDGLRGGRERRDPRPVRRRRRRRADRRALHAGAARRGARIRPARRSTARSTACTARPPCTSASATPRSSTTRPAAYSFLPELAGCSCAQVSIETAQSNLDCSRAGAARGQEDHARRASISPTRTSRRRRRSPRASGARCRTSPPRTSSSRPTAA